MTNQIHSSLPTSIGWTASPAAHAAAWRIWRRMVMTEVRRGVGVSVAVDGDGNAVLQSVGAPQWEGHWFVISPDGEASDCSEQSAEPLVELPAGLAETCAGPR